MSGSAPEEGESPSLTPVRGRFLVGGWVVDPGLHELRRGDHVVRVEPKVLALLVHLAENAGETISRSDLLDRIWPEQHVVEGVLTRCASQLRIALEDDAQNPTYIQTVPKRGYRLIAPVGAAEEPSPAAGEKSSTEPKGGRPGRLVAAIVGLTLVAGLGAVVLDRREAEEPVEPRARPSIAVLPLVSLSDDPSQEYFSFGMTEALIAELAQISGLHVVSRTSVMRFADSELALPQIAAELGVSSLLEGSVLESDGRVRITLQLVHAESDGHLWAENYERDLVDVLSLQGEIARAVAREIEVRLTPGETERLREGKPVDPDVLRSYLRGRYHWSLRTPEDLELSRSLFERAIERDPSFAPAWAGLADALVHLRGYGFLPLRETFLEAESAARRALSLDSDLAEAHASLGLIVFNLYWDVEQAERAFRRAIELEPSYATAHQWYSELLSLTGRHDEAMAAIELAWRLDPFSPLVRGAVGQRLNAAGRHAAALSRLDEAIALQPSLAWVQRERAYALERMGRVEDALAARRAEMRIRVRGPERLAALDASIAVEGRRGFWKWELERLERLREEVSVPPVLVAEAHGGVGDLDGALEWLERAAEERGLFLLHLVRSPAFDPLRGDPRFEAIRATMPGAEAATP